MEFLSIDRGTLARLRRMCAEIDRFERARAAVRDELDGVSFPGRSERGIAQARVDADGRLLGVTIDRHTVRRGRADLIGAEVVAAVEDARQRMADESYGLIARRLAGSGGRPA